MAKGYIIKINEFPDQMELPFLKLVSEERREQIKRYYKKEDAYRSLTGALLARYGLCIALQCDNNKLKFERNPFGKPYVIPSGMKFNISHSGCRVAGIFDDNEAGIDVEKVETADLSIARRFYHEYEYRRIFETDNKEEGNKRFYFYWSMKEAYLKALGTGLSRELSSFYVSTKENKIIIKDDQEAGNSFAHCTYFCEEGYGVAAVAKTAITWEHLEDQELFRKIRRSRFFSEET